VLKLNNSNVEFKNCLGEDPASRGRKGKGVGIPHSNSIFNIMGIGGSCAPEYTCHNLKTKITEECVSITNVKSGKIRTTVNTKHSL